jgi:hypothetical protein
MTMQFANADDFLIWVQAELGFDGINDQSLDRSIDGTTNPKTSFEISADAKAALASSLDDSNMDLAANSHNLQSPISLVPQNWQWKRNRQLSLNSRTRIGLANSKN